MCSRQILTQAIPDAQFNKYQTYLLNCASGIAYGRICLLHMNCLRQHNSPLWMIQELAIPMILKIIIPKQFINLCNQKQLCSDVLLISRLRKIFKITRETQVFFLVMMHSCLVPGLQPIKKLCQRTTIKKNSITRESLGTLHFFQNIFGLRGVLRHEISIRELFCENCFRKKDSSQ